MSKQTQEIAAEPQKSAPLTISPKYICRLVGTLTGICLVVALLLGIVNQVTKPHIDAIQEAKQKAAMALVLPADSYEKVGFTAANVTAIYKAISGGDQIGWVMETVTSGSQGTITMMVGIDMSLPKSKITGVSVVSHSETPNIGTKVVDDQSVLDRFIGMSHEGGEITVNAGTNRFDGVTGATYSSKGVAAGVNAALAAVNGPAA